MIAEPTDDAALQDGNQTVNAEDGVVVYVQALSRPSLTLTASLVPATTLRHRLWYCMECEWLGCGKPPMRYH